MSDDFLHATLGRTGIKVFRLGLSGTYRPGKGAIAKAMDAGINYFFCYGFDGQTIRALRESFPARRDKLVVSTGAYNLILGHPDLRRTLEKRLRQLGTDYIDIFLYLGVCHAKHLHPDIFEELIRFRDEGKVRAIGISCHDRSLAGKLASDGTLDVAMIRYNAAHRGAEQEIFPGLETGDAGIVSYTATRWGYLLRRPKGYPEESALPTPDQCYRFVLSNPAVHVCLNAPWNEKQLEENIAGLAKGPLPPEEMAFMRRFGDFVHRRYRGF